MPRWKSWRHCLAAAAFAVILAATGSFAQAQTYPARPITLVVPLPPGGTTDIFSRMVAEKMAALLGQPVVVENRALGGSGTVATRAVAKGAPDGYTIVLGYTTTLATGPTMVPTAGYDVRKDFAPLGLIATAPALLLANAGVPAKTIQDVIELIKSAKEPYQIGLPSIGSVSHLAAEMFVRAGRPQGPVHPVQGVAAADHRPDRRPRQARLQSDPGVARRHRRRPDPRHRRHLAEALQHLPRSADHRRGRSARRRRRAKLWAPRAGRNAAADRRSAEPGVARDAGDGRRQAAACARRRRSGADDACRARRRHRPRRSQILGADQGTGPQAAIDWSDTMELISDRSRRVSVDELNTTQLLAHARKQAVQRKLDDMIIVDVDSHHYENECYDEFLPLIENDVLRQLIMAGRTKGRGQVHTGMTSFQDMGGRVTRYPLRFTEKTGKGGIRDVELAFRWMDALSVDYSCLFPTPLLGSACTRTSIPRSSSALPTTAGSPRRCCRRRRPHLFHAGAAVLRSRRVAALRRAVRRVQEHHRLHDHGGADAAGAPQFLHEGLSRHRGARAVAGVPLRRQFRRADLQEP